MADKLSRDLATSTEELTAQPVAELTDAEIAAVAGGMMADGAEIAHMY